MCLHQVDEGKERSIAGRPQPAVERHGRLAGAVVDPAAHPLVCPMQTSSPTAVMDPRVATRIHLLEMVKTGTEARPGRAPEVRGHPGGRVTRSAEDLWQHAVAVAGHRRL